MYDCFETNKILYDGVPNVLVDLRNLGEPADEGAGAIEVAVEARDVVPCSSSIGVSTEPI